ncbi:antigen peptide transporter 1-like [Acipenser ruthenus]|uniref:antigen peptide transporter 1-like n=1 Tax=Acipenser ruthenus TaxID=7906 RepID=UPI0027407E1A|nr:antigen peptide transporter 1-like [Acipenser ruthenus]
MKPLAALACLPVLDVAVTHALRLGLTRVPVPELQLPLWSLWVTGVLRAAVLSLVFCHTVRRAPQCPAWLLSRDALQSVLLLSLLLPCYATLQAVSAGGAQELLWGWHCPSALALGYGVTVATAVLWQRYAPSPSEPGSQKRNGASLRRLAEQMSPDARHFAAVGFFLVVSSLGEMAIPYYTGRMTDWIMNEEEPEAFNNAITAMALITIGSTVSEFVCDLIYNITMSRIHMRIQSRVFRSVLRQDIAFFDTAQTGDITSRITTDTNTMSESLSEKLSLLMWYFMRVLCLFGFMLRLSWKLSLFTAIGLPIIWVIPELTGKFYQKLSVRVQESLAKANAVAMETFSSMKTVRSFANEEGEAQRYRDKLEETYRLNKIEAAAYAASSWTNSLSSLALKVSILYYGGMLVTSGDVSSGDLVSFVLYELQFSSAVEVLLSYYPHVKKAIGASEKIFEYMDREPEMTAGTLAPETLRGHVEFKNVSFTYPRRPDTTVLKSVSFELRPGEITALVGPSGGGKSTCVCLLERFYQPQSGEILLDGAPLQDYQHSYLHRKVALVSQEPVLFARSVQENISYGVEQKSEEEVQRAAKRAIAHDFITELQEGYSTDAGEKGGQLSGGQKQRVAIARALLRDPRILILDDATSSLDTETEHLVQSAVLNGRRCSVLLISHRLSSLERADRIIVLQGGEVVEQGSHSDLLQRGGVYQSLLEKQSRGFDRNGVDRDQEGPEQQD